MPMDENEINVESPGVNIGKPEPYDYLSDILLVMNKEELTLSAAKDKNGKTTPVNDTIDGKENEFLRIDKNSMLESFSGKCRKSVETIEALACSGMIFGAKGITVTNAGWRGVLNLSDDNEDKTADDDNQKFPVLEMGNSFDFSSCNLLKQKPKPKPLFTEASLLAAMEKPLKQTGNEDAAPNNGIGTPATRANIIETLVKRNYIERDNKKLIPTEKGIEIYKAVRNMLISDAKLTAQWENKLAMIENNTLPEADFSDEIREFTKKVVDEISSLRLPDIHKTYLCPKCKLGQITILSKVAKCNYSKCNLTVFRNMCGNILTVEHVEQLIRTGKTPPIKNFRSKKTNNVFNAVVKFNPDFDIEFEFIKAKRK